MPQCLGESRNTNNMIISEYTCSSLVVEKMDNSVNCHPSGVHMG